MENYTVGGGNNSGSLGLGDSSSRYSPTLVSSLQNVETLSLGRHTSTAHTCYTNTSGNLYCWGRNTYGGLGDGTTSDKSLPVNILSSISYANVGGDSSCAVNTSGELYCWGDNYHGQLGDGTTEDRYTPVNIMSSVSSVSLGSKHTCFVTNNNMLYCREIMNMVQWEMERLKKGIHLYKLCLVYQV